MNFRRVREQQTSAPPGEKWRCAGGGNFLAMLACLTWLEHRRRSTPVRVVARHDHSLIAISLGATCFGALTYIGNGPNLLVKAIVEQADLKAPGFFGYLFQFALPVLIPIFVLISLLFFR